MGTLGGLDQQTNAPGNLLHISSQREGGGHPQQMLMFSLLNKNVAFIMLTK